MISKIFGGKVDLKGWNLGYRGVISIDGCLAFGGGRFSCIVLGKILGFYLVLREVGKF